MKHMVLLGIALLACGKNDGSGGGGGGGGGDKSAAAADRDKAKLQGTWRTGDASKPDLVVEIAGDTVKLTRDGKTTSGKLELRPLGHTFNIEGSIYGYIFRGDTLYLAVGGSFDAFEMTDLDNFTLTLSEMSKEKLERKAGKCTYTKDFVDKISQEVPCSVKTEDGKQVFAFKVLDKDFTTKKLELVDRSFPIDSNEIVPDDLINDRHKATKVK